MSPFADIVFIRQLNMIVVQRYQLHMIQMVPTLFTEGHPKLQYRSTPL